MVRSLWFASGVIFGVMMTAVACMQPAYSQGAYGPPPGGEHRVIPMAISQLQDTRAMLASDTGNDYRSHKANAMTDIDMAMNELQICMRVY
jgi:hypothetical protein